MTDLVIVGTGGQAREAHAIVEALGHSWTVLGFLDDAAAIGTRVHDLPVLGGVDWLRDQPGMAVCVGVGLTWSRKALVDRASRFDGMTFPTLIHPTASVGPRVELGQGTLVCPGAVLTTDIGVGEHVLLNFGCTVGHDTVIEGFVTVAPGAHISGAVHIGEGADVGTGASVVQGRSVGAWSLTGAGAAVIEDVPANATVVGVPARVTRQRPAGWHLEMA